MTPKEKALEVSAKFLSFIRANRLQETENGIEDISNVEIATDNAKRCAHIVCDEAIKVCLYKNSNDREDIEQLDAYEWQFISYWEEVKTQIDLL